MGALRDDILKILRSPHSSAEMTYVLANMLTSPHQATRIGFVAHRVAETDAVRRECERLERDGLVRRVPSSYARQICWAANGPGIA